MKSQLGKNGNETNEEVMELTKKAFIFSTYALIALEKGDKRTKKEIAKSLGLNRAIKDKILNIKAHEWYSTIRKGYDSIREAISRFEPNPSFYDFPELRSLGRDLVNEVGTAIRNHNGYIYIPDLSKSSLTSV